MFQNYYVYSSKVLNSKIPNTCQARSIKFAERGNLLEKTNRSTIYQERSHQSQFIAVAHFRTLFHIENMILITLSTLECDPFLANIPILYPLKTPENVLVFRFFQGV